MPKFDIDRIKHAGEGRWLPLFTSLGIPAEVLAGDNREHPCPKCGGETRFRAIDIDRGALYCSHCFSSKNADGIAAVKWWKGCEFPDALKIAAEAFGVEPSSSNGKAKSKPKPEEQLEFMEWNDTLAILFTRAKKGITVDGLKRVGARMARYQAGWNVLAIPIWGPKLRAADPVGYALYEMTGKPLPTKNADGSTSEVKVKTVAGSESGLMGDTEFPEGVTVYKTEGPSDLLTLLSLPDSSRVAAFTNSAGCKQNPPAWMVELVADRSVRVVHDADKPGQEGATFIGDRPGWVPRLAEYAASVVNVQLPYEIAEKSGKDLRDFILEGHGIDDIEVLPGEALTAEQKTQASLFIARALDDPDDLAERNLRQYSSQHGRRLVFWLGRWYRWRDGSYAEIEQLELEAKVWRFISSHFAEAWKRSDDKSKPVKKVSPSIVNAVIKAMAAKCCVSSRIEMPSWLPDGRQGNCIALQNGLLDLDAVFRGDEDNYFQPLTPDWFSVVQLPYAHDDAAACPKWLEHLDYVFEGDVERMQLLQEFAGYCLQPRCHYQKFLALEGPGGDGKSVCMAGIKAMLGEQSVSEVMLDYLGEPAYQPSLVGKAANFSSDSGDNLRAIAEGTLKLIVDGKPITINEKYKQAFTARITAKIICAWNMRPRISDRTDSVWRRILLIPFYRQIPQEKRIPGMDDPDWWIRQGEAPGILCWAIRGLHRLNKQGRFTVPAVMRSELADYRLESNPAAEFLQEHVAYDNDRMIAASLLYDLYSYWCERSGYRPLGERNFGKEVKNAFPLYERVRRNIGHDRRWCYAKISFTCSEVFGRDTESHLVGGV